MTPRHRLAMSFAALAPCIAACGAPNGSGEAADPDSAPVAAIDRFADGFATLFRRSGPAFDPAHVQAALPAPNAPIDFDALFTVSALGPRGELVDYYALDIVSPLPGSAYVLVDSSRTPVAGQLPILDRIPGDEGYNDFVQITEVTVGPGYVANTFTDADSLRAAVTAGDVTELVTSRIESWSLVPAGSSATRTFLGERVDGQRAWVNGEVAHALVFDRDLVVRQDGTTPSSGIVVIFKDDASPAHGFATDDEGRTHNALETLPGEPGYSSLWFHQRGAYAGFAGVVDYPSALANVAGPLPVSVNCPIVD